VPLYVGYALERTRGPIGLPTDKFPGNRGLTDTGVLLLIVAQHVALTIAAFWLISSIADRFWKRLVLAVIFASNPLLYTFAQCVGSETLSMILMIVLATTGLHLIRHRGETTPLRWWYLFALALYLAILTRYVNLLAALLLPIAFLLRAGVSRRQGHLQSAAIALCIGIASIVLARQSMAEVCRWGKYEYQSRFGYTFLWRLNFVAAMPAAERTALLDHVSARTDSADAQTVFTALRAMLNDEPEFWPGRVPIRAAPLMFPPDKKPKMKERDRRRNAALNEVARAFLSPPTEPHLAAAKADFRNVLQMPLGEVTRYLFVTTASVFELIDTAPEMKSLRTFRTHTAEQLRALHSANAYFRLWNAIRLSHLLPVLIAAVVALLIWRSRLEGIAPYAATLLLVGTAMVASTCLLGGILPRYTLPMWELLWVALLIVAGAIADALSSATPTSPSPTPIPYWPAR
jgi:hypothetical protein